jgi:hypothetical protein
MMKTVNLFVFAVVSALASFFLMKIGFSLAQEIPYLPQIDLQSDGFGVVAGAYTFWSNVADFVIEVTYVLLPGAFIFAFVHFAQKWILQKVMSRHYKVSAVMLCIAALAMHMTGYMKSDSFLVSMTPSNVDYLLLAFTAIMIGYPVLGGFSLSFGRGNMKRTTTAAN